METLLREGINWVGYVDWTLRDFHSFETNRGATYNAYLVEDEKTALIDTVKGPYADDLLAGIAERTELSNIDYIVCNHAEPDHSGALPRVLEAIPTATLVCNKKCLAELSYHYDTAGWKTKIIEDGETLSLGRRTLKFIFTPMVHWPESMATYVPEERLLFSMDAFGQHFASSERFDDEAPLCVSMEEAKRYYANIVMPYGKMVTRVLKGLEGVPIDMIAPSHGLIWRSHVADIVEKYKEWAAFKPAPKVLVVFDSMWESTANMARAICDGASTGDVEAKLIHVRRTGLTEIATEIQDAAAVAFGSSTLNSGMMPMMAAALTYIKGLKPAGKSAFAFGSYGWSSGGAKAVEDMLRDMNWDILREPLMGQYRPDDDVLSACRDAGRLLAETAREKAHR